MPLIEDGSRPSSMAVSSRCTTAPTGAAPAGRGRRVSRLTSVKVRWCWCHDPFQGADGREAEVDRLSLLNAVRLGTLVAQEGQGEVRPSSILSLGTT
jgi:hypothetical protein